MKRLLIVALFISTFILVMAPEGNADMPEPRPELLNEIIKEILKPEPRPQPEPRPKPQSEPCDPSDQYVLPLTDTHWAYDAIQNLKESGFIDLPAHHRPCGNPRCRLCRIVPPIDPPWPFPPTYFPIESMVQDEYEHLEERVRWGFGINTGIELDLRQFHFMPVQ